MQRAITLSVSIHRDPADVAAFIRDKDNLSLWAAGLDPSLPVQFVADNDYGIADHYVTLPGGHEIYVPIRVIANDDGSEVLLTLYQQPGMDDAGFSGDQELIAADLVALKDVLEKSV